MSNQQILEKAIQKAIINGWDILDRSESNGFILRKDAYGNPFVAWTSDPKQEDAFAQNYMEIIFNHDFAKALWGEMKGKDGPCPLIFSGWKYHLQQMAIADDPIKYLGENL